MVDQPHINCGVVMPTKGTGNDLEQHWQEVRGIVVKSIQDAGFKNFPVNSISDGGTCQNRMIHLLYELPIVICDISFKNPEVMFALGMRVAFDKPTVIIKDNETDYIFDAASIEYLEYPRNLRYSAILAFQEKLASKIAANHSASKSDSEHSPFLEKFKRVKLKRQDLKRQAFNKMNLM